MLPVEHPTTNGVGEGAAANGSAPPPRLNLLGVGVSGVDMDRAVTTIERWIDDDERQYVCVTGVHGVMESQSDPELRRIHNRAGLVVPDGMPLVWLSRLGGIPDVSRVYGPDLMLACCDRFRERGFRHYLYGGAEGVPERLASCLEERFPGIRFAGTYSPPFRPLTDEEDEEVIRRINESGADLVWVGLSTPKQERWMAAHVDRLEVPVLVGVGAAFDFNSGRKRQAPSWMQRSGLEWLFRMVTEPRRLGKRYLQNNPRFILRVLAQVGGRRRYSL